MSNEFVVFSSENLSLVHGGQQQQTPPPKITGNDAAEVAFKAAKGVVLPASLPFNAPQAWRQYNDPRIKDAGTGTKLLNGFCGIFGIDPLK